MRCTGKSQFSQGSSPSRLLTEHGLQNVALELPREREMRPKDKYTVFARRYWRHGYRKGMHLVRLRYHFKYL